MSYPDREAVAQALFALVDTTLGNLFGVLQTSQRGFIPPSRVLPAMCPALVLRQGKELFERQNGILGIPPKRTMLFEAWVFTMDGQIPSVVPAAQQNAVMGALQDAFEPIVPNGPFPLLDGSGKRIALNAWVRGDIDYLENYIGSGMSLMIVPLEVLIP